MVALVTREDLFPDPHIASFGDRHARAVGHPDHLKCSQLQMPPLNGSRSVAVGPPSECAASMRRNVFDKNFAYVRLVSSVASARLAGAAHARCPNARMPDRDGSRKPSRCRNKWDSSYPWVLGVLCLKLPATLSQPDDRIPRPCRGAHRPAAEASKAATPEPKAKAGSSARATARPATLRGISLVRDHRTTNAALRRRCHTSQQQD
jgi:hypothetical protein